MQVRAEAVIGDGVAKVAKAMVRNTGGTSTNTEITTERMVQLKARALAGERAAAGDGTRRADRLRSLLVIGVDQAPLAKEAPHLPIGEVLSTGSPR
mmetsp:Transcript_43889/g.103813  ORF Transcript_43889/g.103813 Transcript_43889/m.103813 type:complete len:96 (-) Transcript_43889:538-825(-)